MKVKNVRVRPVRGTTLANRGYIGPSGSLSVDTEKNQIRIHDGVTPGGHLLQMPDDNMLLRTYPEMGKFPAMGEEGVLYVAIDTAKAYRWSVGGAYIEIANNGTVAAATQDEVSAGKRNDVYVTPESLMTMLNEVGFHRRDNGVWDWGGNGTAAKGEGQ